MAFTIFLIYHSHIDVGYTERQERIANYQADFIKQSVNCVLSNKQENRTQDSKFKFTAEGFWAIEQYLNKYGQDGEKKLIQAIKTNNFEMTGGYVHFADILDYETLQHSLDYSINFAKEHNIGLPKIAMSADVNGFPIGYSQALYDHGIKYLVTNINTHHGGAPFGKPLVPFYWVTPNGDKILVWSGLTYHKANLLGLIPGMAFTGDPGVPGLKNKGNTFIDINHPDDYAKDMIFEMVENFQKNGYNYDFIPIMGSGLYTDNSPVEDLHCNMIEKWNSLYGDKICIKTVTLLEFFKYLETNVSDIPCYSGDWTDWWTDGAASMPRELSIFKNAQRTLKKIRLLDKNCDIVGSKERKSIEKNLIMFGEHTWGHSHGLTNACDLLVGQLDLRKANFAVQADIQAETAFDKIKSNLGEGEFTAKKPFTYNVINPYNYPVKSEICLETDFWEEGNYVFANNKFAIVDGDKTLISQRQFATRGAEVFAVVDLKPNEKRNVTLKFDKDIIQTTKACLNEQTCIFENDFYILNYDNGVNMIIDKNTGKNILDSKYSLGQPIYQIFKNGIRQDAAGFGYSARKPMKDTRFIGKLDKTFIKEKGDVYTIIQSDYTVEGAYQYTVEYKLYNKLSKIEVTVNCKKTLEMDPEGMYIVLPSSFEGSSWLLDKPGALIKVGEQLPNTCFDYYSVDRGVCAFDGENAVTVNALDAPLVTFGDIKLWKFTDSITPTGTCFSWLTNNKWETNFRCQCSGCLLSRYIIDFAKVNNKKDILNKLEVNDCGIVVVRN